ncbi:MAG: ornithine carbamoyltransferase [Verrucomicrobiota bacterium]
MKHFLKLEGFSRNDAREILASAQQHKAKRGEASSLLKGQTWALLFSKPSTRTRVSFEVAVRELGGGSFFLSSQDIQLGRGEIIIDTARVLGRMVHGAIIRTFDQADVEDFAQASGISTVNALTDEEHPCQILADIFTFEEKRGSIQGKKIAFIGDADCNVARSWVHAAGIFDFQLICAAPEDFQSSICNANTSLVTDPAEAAQDADMLYTDVWVSMGKESETARRVKIFKNYQINEALLSHAQEDALVMHCLPAYRGKEITESVLEKHAKDIFDQAENRLHVQKAILEWLVK